jgi:hypothetical protein
MIFQGIGMSMVRVPLWKRTWLAARIQFRTSFSFVAHPIPSRVPEAAWTSARVTAEPSGFAKGLVRQRRNSSQAVRTPG